MIKCLEITDFPWHEQSQGHKFTFQTKQPFAKVTSWPAVSQKHIKQPKISIFQESLPLQISSFYDHSP